MAKQINKSKVAQPPNSSPDDFIQTVALKLDEDVVFNYSYESGKKKLIGYTIIKKKI